VRGRAGTALLFVVLGLACQEVGASFAVLLFPEAGPLGLVMLRLVFSAVILLCIARPRLTGRSRRAWLSVAAFGGVLALMNGLFYLALERLPLGVTVTIEVLGPLVLSVLASRRASAWLWAALALAGVVALGGGGWERLDLFGVLFALGAAASWALYILASARVGREFPKLDGLALAMALGAIGSLPFGVADAGSALLRPEVLALGAAVAVLSSTIPYTLELLALRRLPASAFAILMSLSPPPRRWPASSCSVSTSPGSSSAASRSSSWPASEQSARPVARRPQHPLAPTGTSPRASASRSPERVGGAGDPRHGCTAGRRRRTLRCIGRPASPPRTPSMTQLDTTSDTATASALPVIGHWIDGAETAPSGGRTAPVYNPATGEVTKHVTLADESDVAAAVASAERGFAVWSGFSIARRQAVLFAFRELLSARKTELAAIITAEHGKVTADAMGEVMRGQEVVDLATGFPHLLKGAYSENVSSGIDVYSLKQPLGVVGIISPFNFPAMVPMWFFTIALAAGNAVVVKPSEKDPSASLWLARLWQEAGLPDGVFTVLQGDKVAVDGLLSSPVVQSISFVGSTPIARYIYETAARHGKRVQALGGAKNHMLVLPDADLDLVADQAVNAGYGAAGERCMAVSVVLAVEPVADDLISRITERISRLRIGNGAGSGDGVPDMGPLITGEHREKVASYVDIAEADGATIVVDGRGFAVEGHEDGFWFGPTLIDGIPTTSRAYREEIFGPVLEIVRVETFQEGLDLINSGAFGNGTAIFTNDGGAARRFQSEVQVGMIGINVPIPVPVAYHSFGGWKASLFGDAKAYGVHGFDFFTREKAITSRWLDPATRDDSAHGGINLGFPRNS
jgi:malonate-semialdehyde dehydrogenase (acetylating)/methylmalonate-semialdehyde dehydrogenase